MGVMELFFGDGRNVVSETVGVFREHADRAGEREARMKHAALGQFAAEFARPARGPFDRAIDALNRLPRPILAFGTIGLLVTAMLDPVWFASRMQGIALVPEPLWWLMGAIVSFYFGARHQAKGQEFRRSVADTAARAVEVRDTMRRLDAPAPAAGPANPALAEWRAGDGG